MIFCHDSQLSFLEYCTIQSIALPSFHNASGVALQYTSQAIPALTNEQVRKQFFSRKTIVLPAVSMDEDTFRKAVAVVIAHAVYLPSVQCFALLPVASTLQRTGADTGAALDYDMDKGCVTLTAQRTIRQAAC